MRVQVTVTRTDTGATTQIMSEGAEAWKQYPSWGDAISDAKHQGLINPAEAMSAKALPPGLPLYTTTEIENGNFAFDGFTAGRTSPPQ
jgi:hypothetical protein